MSDEYLYDVFLSHSSKDKAIVRPLAERLRKDGVKVWFDEWEIRPGDSIPAKVEEGLESSRVLVLCMSANAFGSDWAQLESGTFRFRDPLNKERRFLPLRLDAVSVKGSLAQFLYIDWLSRDQEIEYQKLRSECGAGENISNEETQKLLEKEPSVSVQLDYNGKINTYDFDPSGRCALTGDSNSTLRFWNLYTGRKLKHFDHSRVVKSVALSRDGNRALSGANDGEVRVWDLIRGKCTHVLHGHLSEVNSVAWGPDGSQRILAAKKNIIEMWDLDLEGFSASFHGHTDRVRCLAWSSDGQIILSGSNDRTLRLWNPENQECLGVLAGHSGFVRSVVCGEDRQVALSGSSDKTVRLWDLNSYSCTRVFEGHTHEVTCVAFSSDKTLAISGSLDKTIRLWDVKKGKCLSVFSGHKSEVVSVGWSSDRGRAFSGDIRGSVRIWDLTEFVKESIDEVAQAPEQFQYTNAKVLIVGDTHAGKTGLTHRLATGHWKPSDDSTVGAWSTQWQLKDVILESDVDREIWLWDFGGQADQRLIHQLYMDRTALILLLFNADQEDVLPGLRDWQTALRRSVKDEIPHFLVAGRIDTGFKASRGKLQAFAKEQGLPYHETSAKSGDGCDELRAAMIAGIPWAQMEKRTSPRIFKLIKDEILKLRDEGQVLHTFKELRELLWRRLPDESRFADETLQTVIGLLDGPGVVKELDYGTYILLAPEWINAYAQAVIRTLRSAENDLGVLPLRSIAEGKLIYQSIGRDGVPVEMKRLAPVEERVVLGEMELQLEQRGLCLRQGDKLVFPSHCGRDRPVVLEHPSVFVSYAVDGFLDDIYATLVVKLVDSDAFKLAEVWRDAADFTTLRGDYHMGIKLTRESASAGEVSVYFGKGVTQEEQVIFANFIHSHLSVCCENTQRLRFYVCPKCNTPKGNPKVLMEKLQTLQQEADTECDKCGNRFPLWDVLEQKFANFGLEIRMGFLHTNYWSRIDSRRKGKLLALEVAARISSADQKCFEIPGSEDEGIDIELEFTDDEGKGTGRRLYLQLKAGNSHLRTRKSDGAEVFSIKEQRWVKYWMAQKEPVMLVIGTIDQDMEYADNKVEFADVRWMEISSVLNRESNNGKRQVKQFEFKGERLDLSSVRRWREKVLAG